MHTKLHGIDEVLLKFYFTNEAKVPKGIPFQTRDQAVVNEGHRARAQTSLVGPSAAMMGRVRFGHIDNGVNWANNVRDVCGGNFVHQTLMDNDYSIADAHYYHQPARHKPGGKPGFEKWVVVLTYRRGAEGTSLPNPALLKGAEKEAAELTHAGIINLMRRKWGYLHGWNNVAGGAPTITLNFNHDEGEGAGRWAVVVENDTMKIVPTPVAQALMARTTPAEAA